MDLSSLAGLANAGALVLFIVLFIKGDIMPKVVVDRMLRFYDDRWKEGQVEVMAAIAAVSAKISKSEKATE